MYKKMMNLVCVVGVLALPTSVFAQSDGVDEDKESPRGNLSLECINDYRFVREELYELRQCEQQSDCVPVLFSFPFGPEKCIFYGVNSDHGKSKLEQAWSTVNNFTEQCAKGQPDYEAWLADQEGEFKMRPQDCIKGGMFAECEKGYCVTKFAYEQKEFLKKSDIKAITGAQEK